MTMTATQMVAQAKTRIENLSVAQVAEEIDGGEALVVDIREPDERQRDGYIAGALAAPRGMLEFWADPSSPSHRDEFQPGSRTILYCASGGRSALAAAVLQDLGYENVAHLDGGLNAWTASGHGACRNGS
jgi:rhodanese-related sulfurtransferase